VLRPVVAALRHWRTVGTNPRPLARYFACAGVDLVAHWSPRSHGVNFQQAISSAGDWDGRNSKRSKAEREGAALASSGDLFTFAA
jgi:hypothetical protein